MATPNRLDSVISLAKRRGFVFQAGEIYGGSRSAWDYGPLGVELKENIKRQWWRTMVQSREDIVGLGVDHHGESVALSADGETLAVGAMFVDYHGVHSGRATVFRWDETLMNYMEPLLS